VTRSTSSVAAAVHERRPWFGALLVAAIVVLGAVSLTTGPAHALTAADVWRGLVAALGLGEPLSPALQVVVETRIERLLLTIGVGAGLALSGALMQGVFRNDLASPGLLGVTSGASLGASLAIIGLGGAGPLAALEAQGLGASTAVGIAAFAGAAATTALVARLGTSDGRVSVPALLLVGIAINAVIGGLVTAIHSFALRDYEVSLALFTWGFGTLDDRGGTQVAFVLLAVALAAAVVPFVARELDLFAAGEDDARSLGVDTTRVKWMALLSASLAAGATVAVAGQIAFVGLIVPHLVRLLATSSHGRLLRLCLLAGPVLMLLTDIVPRALDVGALMRPGVTLSLFGGPFFLYLLVRERRRIATW
jgi:iron complex transport system permease protein